MELFWMLLFMALLLAAGNPQGMHGHHKRVWPGHHAHLHDDLNVNCTQAAHSAEMTHLSSTRIRILVMYHNAATGITCATYARCKDYIQPVFIPRSVYFESMIYRDYLRIILPALTARVEYILLCTYKHADPGYHGWLPSHPRYLSTELTKELLHNISTTKADLLPLILAEAGTTIRSSLSVHGDGALRAFEALLTEMGFTQEEIDTAARNKCFWRSSYLIKPSALMQITSLMLRAMEVVERSPKIGALFGVNSGYVGDPKVAKEVFGTEYYQLHPFLFERLPAFFAGVLGLKVEHLMGEGFETFVRTGNASKLMDFVIG